MPGRPTPDIEVGAEAQGMHRRADHSLDRLEATEVDDRDNFFATSQKLWPRLETTFGDPSIRLQNSPRKTLRSQRGPAPSPGLRAPPPRHPCEWSEAGSPARNAPGGRPAARSASASKIPTSASRRARPGRSCWGRSRWHSGDRGKRLADAQGHPFQRSRGKAFDRIAID